MRVDVDQRVVVGVVNHRHHQFRCPVEFKVGQERLALDGLMVAVGRWPVGRRGADAYVSVAVGPDQFVAVAGRLPVGFRAGESGRPHIDVERRRRRRPR